MSLQQVYILQVIKLVSMEHLGTVLMMNQDK